MKLFPAVSLIFYVVISSFIADVNSKGKQIEKAYFIWSVTSRHGANIQPTSPSVNGTKAVIPHGTLLLGAICNHGNSVTIAFPYNGNVSKVDLRLNDDRSMSADEDRVYHAGNGLLRRHRSSVLWTGQWLIGTGKTGAMVGGHFHKELVPLSAADLFVKKRNAISTKFYERAKEGFTAARKALIAKNFKKVMRGMERTEVGIDDSHLEYAADLTFCYSSNRFIKTDLNNRRVEGFEKDRDLRSQPFDALKSVFPPCQINAKIEASHVSFLDTKTGITSTLFAAADKTLHRREWFAASGKDVIVGSLDCRNATNGGGCLNMAVRLSRQSGWHSPDVYVARRGGRTLKLPVAEGGLDADRSVSVQGTDLWFVPSRMAITPHVYVCLLVICHGGIGKPTDWSTKLDDTLVCHGADRADVISGVEKSDTYAANKASSTANATLISELRARCHLKLERVLKLGVDKLRERHRNQFENKMSRMSLSLGSEETSDGDAADGPAQIEGAFALGRYLMLSAASGAVTNLQGIWADGRKSMWNGDYHININMQMHYWSADTARIPEILPPLFSFIHKLMTAGSLTAKEMYDCPGWVAHGFTDGYLLTGVGGAYIWAFCVTCGAWIALSIWDHLTFSMDAVVLVHDLLPAFKGIADFFLAYMWVDESGNLHTGPTTSPENSYSVRRNAESEHYQVAMTPAIDSSVLRQAAIAYSLAVEAVKTLHGNGRNMVDSASLNLDEHLSTAEKFLIAVKRMPHHALPVVGKKSGLILEYPTPYPDAVTDMREEYTRRGQGASYVDENVDLQHRHYSSLHWLYPGLFLPDRPRGSSSGEVEGMYAAARKLLEAKDKAGSAHTAWGATWMACLWARLGDGDAAWVVLRKIFSKYSTANLLFLHPPMSKESDLVLTLYKEIKSVGRERSAPCISRGLKTLDKSPFQLDGNAGVVAAIVELLVQSHMPGYLHLLPALPRAVAKTGHVVGVGARGDVTVSLAWRRGGVAAAVLLVGTVHPWHAPLEGSVTISGGLQQPSPGYYQWAAGWGEATVSSFVVVTPGAVRLHSSAAQTSVSRRGKKRKNAKKAVTGMQCADWVGPETLTVATDPSSRLVGARLRVTSVPCEIRLCSSSDDDDMCLIALGSLT